MKLLIAALCCILNVSQLISYNNYLLISYNNYLLIIIQLVSLFLLMNLLLLTYTGVCPNTGTVCH